MSDDDHSDIMQAIGRLEGTVKTQHDATRSSVSTAFDKIEKVEGRLTKLEKRVIIISMILISGAGGFELLKNLIQ